MLPLEGGFLMKELTLRYWKGCGDVHSTGGLFGCILVTNSVKRLGFGINVSK
jgi:hypothetical protein